jgi:Transposase DDE domain
MIMPPPKESPNRVNVRQPYALETLARLPLAEAFYRLWSSLAPDAVLDSLFEQHRGRCYDDLLRFADLVQVLTDALTRYHGSGRAAIGNALSHQQLPCQQRAVYGKLGRVPLPLAEAFLSTLTGRLRPLFPAGLYHTTLPQSLAALTVIVLDGKKIKKAAKRLLATRGRPGKLYGGKILAAYLPAEGLALTMVADPDGEANDIRLVPRVLPLARAAVAGPRLWVADRQFCDLDQTARFTEEDDHFLIRFSNRNGFTEDPERSASSGVDGSGRRYTQQWGWMGAAKEKRRRYVRRIQLERPGEEPIVLVTDLTDAQAYPAEDLLLVYLARWQIENVFQQITEVFSLWHLIGCSPAATVFQASLCLVIYNVLQLLRGYIAACRPEPTAVIDLSAEMIFRDLHEELVSLHKTLTVEELWGVLRPLADREPVGEWLHVRLGKVWSPLWQKARNKKARPQRPKAKQSGAHTSVHKILQKTKQQKQKATPRKRQ